MMQTSRYSPGFPQTVRTTLRRGYEVRRTDLAAALPFRDQALLSPSGNHRALPGGMVAEYTDQDGGRVFDRMGGTPFRAEKDKRHPSQRKRFMRS